MQKNKRRKPALLRRSHYWLGLTLALPLVLLAVTGLLLNHTSDLRLNQRHTAQSWLLKVYGVEPVVPQTGYLAGHQWISHARDQVWINDKPLADSPAPPLGVTHLDGLIVVAYPGRLALFTTDGRQVENLNLPQKIVPLTAIASQNGKLLVRGRSGVFSADSSLLTWSQTNHAWPGGEPAQTLPAGLQARINNQLAANTLTWEKIILDVHSGHIFGRWGSLVLDFVALITAVLAISGCLLWLRRSPRSRPQD